MEAHHLMLPIMLLLLVASLFTVGASATSSPEHDAASGLHPVVLMPGYTCSQLDARLTGEYQPPSPACGARRRRGWFRLWENTTALQEDPALLPCYADQLRLVYDRAAGDYRNVPGVDTRVVSFGTTRGFGSDDPAQKNSCMERLAGALEEVGYREGQNLFGAPFDFRYAPAASGMAARVFSDFTMSLIHLVERASKRNGGKPAVLVGHSQGSAFAIEFLNRSPLSWRRRYVKHFVMLGFGTGGSPGALQSVAPNTGSATSPVNVLSFRNTSRSFPSAFIPLPSPLVYGHRLLVITEAKNYTAYDIPEFLAAVGFSGDEVARYRTRVLPITLNLRAPVVPITCINGVGVPTPDKLVYWDGNFNAKPQVVYGDGDGAINLVSVLALDTVIGGDPAQRYFKSVLIPNMTHNGLVSDDLALKRVVSEILEACLLEWDII